MKGDIKNCEEVIVRGFFDAGNVEAKSVVVEANGKHSNAKPIHETNRLSPLRHKASNKTLVFIWLEQTTRCGGHHRLMYIFKEEDVKTALSSFFACWIRHP